MDRKKDIKLAKKFKKELSKILFLKKLILFGSRAKGGIHKYSDFDFIIVSDDFDKKLGRTKNICPAWKEMAPADFICLTTEEFNEAKDLPTVVQLATKEGIEI